MRFLVGVLLLLSGCFLGYSQQFSTEVYHEGFLVTSDNDTLVGSLKYDMEANVLSLMKGTQIKSFSSQNIFYFEILDGLLNNYRRFYSLPYNVNYGYKIPIFFELVYEGKVSLMSREAIVQQVVNSSASYWGGTGISQWVVQYDFYLLDNKGNLTFFSGKKNDLYAIFPRKQRELRDYIKTNRLNVGERKDLIRVIAFYNSI